MTPSKPSTGQQQPDRPQRPRPYRERARRELLCRSDAVEGRGGAVAEGDRSWFRPGELLLNSATAKRYAGELSARAGKPDRDFARVAKRAGLDLQRFYLAPETDVLDLVAWIRADADRRPEGQRVVVGANFCWRGEPKYQGGPGGEPQPAKARRLADGKRSKGDACDIAALDTGVVADLPGALTACLRPDADDDDRLDVDGNGVLESQNGHGSFVAGVIHQVAPDLVVDPGRVLDSTGVGDDASVTREVLETGAPVINLSLGGYTEDDRAPTAMAEAMRVLTRTRVVVAAAGNNGSDRPFWPAAFKGVVAVAAYDSRGRRPQAAEFSNFGSWVDVCAPGVGIVSTFATFPSLSSGSGPVFSGWATWDGTSFAAPQVAAALAEQVRSGLSPRDAVTWLLEVACRYDPALADYGLVFTPAVWLT